jgi:hypothetical protein
MGNWFTEGGEVVSHASPLSFIPRKIPRTHLCWKLSRCKAIVRLEGLGPLLSFYPNVETKLPGHEADYPYRCTAEVKNGGAVASRPHLPLWHIA